METQIRPHATEEGTIQTSGRRITGGGKSYGEHVDPYAAKLDYPTHYNLFVQNTTRPSLVPSLFLVRDLHSEYLTVLLPRVCGTNAMAHGQLASVVSLTSNTIRRVFSPLSHNLCHSVLFGRT